MKSSRRNALRAKYTSFEDYQKDVYGKSVSEQDLFPEDAKEFGVRLARESLMKARSILRAK